MPRTISDLAEARLTKAVTDWATVAGWKPIRMLPGKYLTLDGKRYVTGPKKGTSDWLFVRQRECFFCELKAPGKEPSEAQIEFLRDCTRDGTPAFWCDSIEEFLKAYWRLFPI